MDIKKLIIEMVHSKAAKKNQINEDMYTDLVKPFDTNPEDNDPINTPQEDDASNEPKTDADKVQSLVAFVNACLDSTSADELYDFVQNNAEKVLDEVGAVEPTTPEVEPTDEPVEPTTPEVEPKA